MQKDRRLLAKGDVGVRHVFASTCVHVQVTEVLDYGLMSPWQQSHIHHISPSGVINPSAHKGCFKA